MFTWMICAASGAPAKSAADKLKHGIDFIEATAARSSWTGGHRNMSDENIIQVIRLADGTVYQECADGSLKRLNSETNWSRFDAMTDEEVEANALAVPDNPPWTEEDLARA